MCLRTMSRVTLGSCDPMIFEHLGKSSKLSAVDTEPASPKLHREKNFGCRGSHGSGVHTISTSSTSSTNSSLCITISYLPWILSTMIQRTILSLSALILCSIALVKAQKCMFCATVSQRVVNGRWSYRFPDGQTCQSAYLQTIRLTASSSQW